MICMVTATQSKTDKLLTQVLREVREVRALVEPISRAVQKPKKAKQLPKWLEKSLNDRVYGPFHSIKELRASLERKA